MLLLLSLAPQLLASLQARVDRQYAYEGETITLSISTESRTNLPDPDFSPLARDFEIGGTSESTQISIFNGQRSDRHTWSIRLMPKRTGKIEIPAIRLGNETTLPLSVDIKPIPVRSGNDQGEAIFITLEVDAESEQFYVQQQIPLVARLYYKHDLAGGNITDPKPEDALLEQLGEDRTYSTNHNGQNYRVFERRYSLLAEKSGELQIPAVSFSGYLASKSRSPAFAQNDLFNKFFAPQTALSKGQPVSLRSKALTIDIQPHPPGFDGSYWLPAESLQLKDSWTEKPPVFRVGEPVSRIISIEAKGLLATQIQPLELPQVSSFRRYAEPPELETRTDGKSVYATSRRTFTYIPQFAGKQEIPALELKWWNVLTGRQESARLPAWKIQVEADPNQANTPVPPPVVPQQPIPQASVTDNSQVEASLPETSPEPTVWQQIRQTLKPLTEAGWPVQIAVLTGSLLLIMILRMLARIGRQPHVSANLQKPGLSVSEQQPSSASQQEQLRQAIEAFRAACHAHQANDAARALLMMAMRTWPEAPPMSLGALAEQLPDAADKIIELDRYLYSDQQQPWAGDELCRLLGNGLHIEKPQHTDNEVLKPLYPN